jgi:integrase
MDAIAVTRNGQRYWRKEIPAKHLPPGKRRETVQAKTKEAVEKKWLERVQAYQKGIDAAKGLMTTGEFLQEFVGFCKSNQSDLDPATIAYYVTNSQNYLLPHLADIPLGKLSTRDVDLWLKRLRESVSERTKRKLSPATVHHAHITLRRALNYAVDWRYIAANPANERGRAAKRNRKDSHEPEKIRIFEKPQALRFIDAAKNVEKYSALFLLGITTGLRPGEQFGLKWGDIDFQGGKLTVHRSLKRNPVKDDGERKRVYFGPPKTKGSRRTIEIPNVLIEALRKHRAYQETQRAFAGDSWQEHGLVFTSDSGTPLDTSNVLHAFQRLCKSAGLPKLRYYDLRHTHASLLIADGVHVKKISERLGHSSITVTMDKYGHLMEGSGRESAERMDEFFGGKPVSKPEPPAEQATGEPGAETQGRKGGKLLVMPTRKAV